MNHGSSVVDIRIRTSLIVALVGLILLAVMVILLARMNWEASDIVTLAGVFTSVLGTLVGAILGVQVGSAGKAKAEKLAELALDALPPDIAKQIRHSV